MVTLPPTISAVVDHKPPRLAGDDRATLLALLQYQRDSFVRKVSGLATMDAQSSQVSSGMSLLWLTNHMADAETTWVLRRFARQDDTDASTEHPSEIEAAIARYEQVWISVDAVIADAVSLDEPCEAFDDQGRVNLRWILAHLLEETARHAGHADILRELIDGEIGR